MDGWIDPYTEAAFSAAIEPSIDLTLTTGFFLGHGLRTACARAYRIRLGADHGVHLRGYLSALALR